MVLEAGQAIGRNCEKWDCKKNYKDQAKEVPYRHNVNPFGLGTRSVVLCQRGKFSILTPIEGEIKSALIILRKLFIYAINIKNIYGGFSIVKLVI